MATTQTIRPTMNNTQVLPSPPCSHSRLPISFHGHSPYFCIQNPPLRHLVPLLARRDSQVPRSLLLPGSLRISSTHIPSISMSPPKIVRNLPEKYRPFIRLGAMLEENKFIAHDRNVSLLLSPTLSSPLSRMSSSLRRASQSHLFHTKHPQRHCPKRPTGTTSSSVQGVILVPVKQAVLTRNVWKRE